MDGIDARRLLRESCRDEIWGIYTRYEPYGTPGPVVTAAWVGVEKVHKFSVVIEQDDQGRWIPYDGIFVEHPISVDGVVFGVITEGLGAGRMRGHYVDDDVELWWCRSYDSRDVQPRDLEYLF